MDEFADFFDFSKPFVRKTIPAGICDGRIKSTSMNNDRINGSQQRNDVERGSSYAEKYLEEDDELAKVSKNMHNLRAMEFDFDASVFLGSVVDIHNTKNLLMWTESIYVVQSFLRFKYFVCSTANKRTVLRFIEHKRFR